MQTNTKRRATPSEVSKQIVKLKQYHQQGCESLASNASHVQQAKALGWTITKFDKARLFAYEYSALDLDALCESLKQHRPDFGVAHVGLLVTLRGPLAQYRNDLQEKCISNNWSTEKLNNEMLTTLGSRNCRGGRRPHVTAETTTIQVSKKANTFMRFVNELKLIGAPLSKKMRRQLQRTAKEAELLRALAGVELEQQRKGK